MVSSLEKQKSPIVPVLETADLGTSGSFKGSRHQQVGQPVKVGLLRPEISGGGVILGRVFVGCQLGCEDAGWMALWVINCVVLVC